MCWIAGGGGLLIGAILKNQRSSPLEKKMEEKAANDTNPLRGVQLQHYQCHKRVMAKKFIVVESLQHYTWLVFEDGTKLEMPQTWVQKHQPKAPGYLVQYEDGYQSYSPVKSFESGYTLLVNAQTTRAAAIERISQELTQKPGGMVSGSIHPFICDLVNAYNRAEQLTGPSR